MTSPHSVRCGPLQRQALPGFTAIELLVVVGIIGLLIGLLVVGLRSFSDSQKRNGTKNRLELLENVLAEATRDKAARDRFYDSDLLTLSTPTGGAADPQLNVVGFTTAPTPFRVPGQALQVDPDVKRIEAFQQTARVLAYLSRSPAAKGLLESLPADVRSLKFQDIDASSFAFESAEFTAKPNASDRSTWTFRTPLVLDDWGNPILFVVDGIRDANGKVRSDVGGLILVRSDSSKVYYWPLSSLGADADNYLFPGDLSASDYGRVNDPRRGGDQPAVRSPDRTPFFVSAGPDGDFRTHDDNVYSFEN